jgi:peptide/nickel transport system substrate-binding protein
LYKYLIISVFFTFLFFTILLAQEDIIVDSDDYGDRLKIGYVWNGDMSFNTLVVNHDYDFELKQLVFGNGLFTKADDGHIIHNLALETRVDSPTRFRFELRSNLLFHDGTLITAEDVKFSYELYKKNALKSSEYYSARLINSIEIYGSNVIHINLEQPVDNFIETLGLFPIIPKHIYNNLSFEDFRNMKLDPVGNGAFKFSKYIPKKILQIDRNEKHFLQKTYLSGIDFVFFDTYDQLLDAFLQEQVDLIKVKGKSTIQKINQFAGTLIKSEKDKKSLYYINLNTNRKPFNEIAVRKAINFSINKKQIISTLFEKNGKEATHLFPDINQINKLKNSNSEYFPLEGLQILLNKKFRRNTNGKLERSNQELNFDLLFEKGSSFEESISRIISINLGEIGINVNPLSVKPNILEQKLKSGRYQATIQQFEFHPGNINESIYNFYTFEINKEGKFNNYRNNEIRKLIENTFMSFGTHDDLKTINIYNKNILQNVPVIYLFFNNYDYYAVNPRFENFKVSYHQSTEKFVEKLKPKHEWFVKKNNHKFKSVSE